MTTETNYCVVLTTTSSKDLANELAKKILEEKLAACIQIQEIASHYVWKNEVCNESEHLLYIKTTKSIYGALQDFIKKNHSYETPEIIQIPISAGYVGYLNWISENVNG
jgi:periplasmic divalent cation tolerance protein